MVAETCDRVAVMQALVRSIPRVDRDVTMEPIPGTLPSLLGAPGASDR